MIYNVLSSMRHSKLRVLLMLFLSTITFLLTLLTLTNSSAFNTQVKMVEEMFLSSLDTTYKIDVSYIENFDTAGVAFAELKKFVNEQTQGTCGAYDQSGECFDELSDNSKFIELNKVAYKDTFRADSPNIVETVFFDPEILQTISIGLNEESFFPVIQNNESYLPMYVGKNFENVISIGDILTLSRNGAKYIVKGYLYDEKWFDDSDPITMPPTSLNHKFIAPFSEFDRTDSISQQSTVGKILIHDETENKAIIDSISDKAIELGIKLRITSVSDFIEQWEYDNHKILKINFALTSIVFLCSAISIISLLCVTVLLKKREYGIRIAFGTTKQQIIFSLCTEIILINLLSGIMAFSYVYHNYTKSIMAAFEEIYIRTLCSTSLLGLVVLMVSLIVFVLIIPTVIMARYSPVELVKEEE